MALIRCGAGNEFTHYAALTTQNPFTAVVGRTYIVTEGTASTQITGGDIIQEPTQSAGGYVSVIKATSTSISYGSLGVTGIIEMY